MTVAILSDWRDELEAQTSIDLAWRGIKVFRALWLAMAGLNYCSATDDPTRAIRNRAPKGRSETWPHGEAVRLVKQSWRMGYHAVACIIAIAWDSQLSVSDARTLRVEQMTDNGEDIWFIGNRSKTEEPFVATVGRMTGRLIRAHLAMQDAPLDAGILFLTPERPAPYRKNSLAEHFREIRTGLFGPDEKRQLRDMRRSGTFEARAGGAQWSDIGEKMANSIAGSKRLQQTILRRNWNPLSVSTKPGELEAECFVRTERDEKSHVAGNVWRKNLASQNRR